MAMTRTEAVRARARLMRDADFVSKFLAGDPAAQDKLTEIATGIVGDPANPQKGVLTADELRVTGLEPDAASS